MVKKGGENNGCTALLGAGPRGARAGRKYEEERKGRAVERRGREEGRGGGAITTRLVKCMQPDLHCHYHLGINDGADTTGTASLARQGRAGKRRKGKGRARLKI